MLSRALLDLPQTTSFICLLKLKKEQFGLNPVDRLAALPSNRDIVADLNTAY